MSHVWDGIVDPVVLNDSEVAVRQALADAAKRADWPGVIAILLERPQLVNTTRPGGASLYTPLHQAAYSGAPAEITAELIRLGAWRTVQNANGERPVDIAERRAHGGIVVLLEPVLRRRIPSGILLKIQRHFHEVILGRTKGLVEQAALRLPELEPLLELEPQNVWFAIPGMYGGFSYDFRSTGVEAVLVSESWCRVVGGSGQRHEVSSGGSRLVAEGFV